jgi:prophage regulatory protein
MSMHNPLALAVSQDRLIRKPEVLSRTGLGNTTLYALVKQGRFPPPLPIAGRAVAWREIDINGWISDRISAARSRTQSTAANPTPVRNPNDNQQLKESN